jgi:P-type conjugative transfer protein TrbG
MRAFLCALAAAAIASSSASWAADYGAAPVEDESVITPPVVELSPSEQAAVARAVAWRSKKAVLRTGPDGKVLFAFGHSQPTVVCAPLQVCDIEFEAGEIVKDVNLGDTVRWKIAPATSGPTGPGEIPHLIVKPNSVSLNTTLVVTTNRRTYSIRLKSVRGSYMDRVGFEYPADKPVAAARGGGPVGRPAALSDIYDDRYVVAGNAAFRPVRVYNDGIRTFLEMPLYMRSREAPVLHVIDRAGQQQIVNYRLQDDRYIVDQVFDRAVLSSGVGWTQEKVTIYRGELDPVAAFFTRIFN